MIVKKKKKKKKDNALTLIRFQGDHLGSKQREENKEHGEHQRQNLKKREEKQMHSLFSSLPSHVIL